MSISWEAYKKLFFDYALDRGVTSFDVSTEEFRIWEAYQSKLNVDVAFKKIF